jgi:hypothetical protein
MSAPPKRVAALVTCYWRMSHAEVIVGRLLRGYYYEGERCPPRVQVASLYVDQFPDNDMSRAEAEAHGVPIYGSIAEALRLGGERLAVDGVVIVGEHGVYPFNLKGQELYPRFHFFRQVVEVFRDEGRSLPVFCDKHLSHDWEEAKWMYDMSRALGFPLMAGSSAPVAWREPEADLECDTPVRRAVAIGHGPKERYGIHLLEALQCLVERRAGGETGVSAVRCIEGEAAWDWLDARPWAARLVAEAGAHQATPRRDAPRDHVERPVLFVLAYRDGLQAVACLLNGWADSMTVALDTAPENDRPWTVRMVMQKRPHAHFSGLVHHLEEMMLTGAPSWPVERTLLTTGMLAAAYDASYRHGAPLEEGRLVETPHLHLAYRAPAGSCFQRGPQPECDPDFGIGP